MAQEQYKISQSDQWSVKDKNESAERLDFEASYLESEIKGTLDYSKEMIGLDFYSKLNNINKVYKWMKGKVAAIENLKDMKAKEQFETAKIRGEKQKEIDQLIQAFKNVEKSIAEAKGVLQETHQACQFVREEIARKQKEANEVQVNLLDSVIVSRQGQVAGYSKECEVLEKKLENLNAESQLEEKRLAGLVEDCRKTNQKLDRLASEKEEEFRQKALQLLAKVGSSLHLSDQSPAISFKGSAFEGKEEGKEENKGENKEKSKIKPEVLKADILKT